MYLNNVTLTGFLGGDAETRTTKNNTTFTAFSLATKNSWKDRETGEWASRTEWHRIVIFGPLTTVAATLKKGDYVQIQGQLRTREYVKDEAKKTVTEIRGTSIVKLERSRSQQTTAHSEKKEVA
jgi:single-strand DNA-binding protein